MPHNEVQPDPELRFPIKPFLRWAGGKSLFVDKIVERLPPVEEIGTYYEPFLGAGSVFLAYQPPNASLSDLNDQLINAFASIRSNFSAVNRELRNLAQNDSEDFYYEVRERYNRGRKGPAQAAKFIYLNRSCFNGIFRVNTKGEFNVPYGHKKNLITPSRTKLEAVSKVLAEVSISTSDFRECIATAGKGDIVYLDPPYPPINGSSYFTHYTKERFSTSDQESVAEEAFAAGSRGSKVLVTNADTPIIRDLYQGWEITPINRPRYITSSKHKHKVSELIITNYS